jgi:hypothetical protein
MTTIFSLAKSAGSCSGISIKQPLHKLFGFESGSQFNNSTILKFFVGLIIGLAFA